MRCTSPRACITPPGELTANVMRQGASITQEDSLFVTLDPFNTRRGGYFFGLNAHGVRFDGLYRNVSEYYSDWDSIWVAGAQRFEGRLDGRVRDPVQVVVVRSEQRHVGAQFLAQPRDAQRGHGVGVAQSALGPEHARGS